MDNNEPTNKLNDEWYGARKKHYASSATIAWAEAALKHAELEFAELAVALGNRRKPIPSTFFKIFAISDSKCHPIFKLLRPRRFASLVEAGSEISEKERTHIWTSIIKPYSTDWEKILLIIENRLPGQAKVIELRQAFGIIFSLQHEMISNPDSATRDAIKKYMDTFDRLWPSWEMLATLLPIGRPAGAMAGAVRGRYDKYCLKNSVLADMFCVDTKTISRWKKEQSYWADRFRKYKDSLADMQKLATLYKANRDYSRVQRASGRKATSRQSYNSELGYKGLQKADYTRD